MNIGSIIQWTSNTIPDGWLLCDGTAVSRTTYADLFSVIGTTYGTGDGSTTFNVPDLRGRVGVGKSSDAEFDTLGETGGEKTHTLTINEIPNHQHNIQGLNPTGSSVDWTDRGVSYGNDNIGFSAGVRTSYAGGGQPHNILQPYIVTNYIIKALNPDTIKISELESASSITSSDVLPIVQNGETKKMNILNMIYPIGSIYISTLETNPSTYFGGVWQPFGQGRTLVGLKTQDSDFDTLLKAGGSKELQEHIHTNTSNAVSWVQSSGLGNTNWLSAGGDQVKYTNFASPSDGVKAGWMANTNSIVNSAGTGDSGNLQPYIVVSMWLRIG